MLRVNVEDFSNFGSLKSTETDDGVIALALAVWDFSNFGSLKSTETRKRRVSGAHSVRFQQFRLVEEH